jgi:hypothetical protein
MPFATIPLYYRKRGMSADGALDDLFEFWTPSEIRTYVNGVAKMYVALANDIKSKKGILTPQRAEAWLLLGKDFEAFLQEYETSPIWALSMGPVRSAERFAEQFKYWREDYERLSGEKATGGAWEPLPVLPPLKHDVAIPSLPPLKHNVDVQLIPMPGVSMKALGIGAAVTAGIVTLGFIAYKLLR